MSSSEPAAPASDIALDAALIAAASDLAAGAGRTVSDEALARVFAAAVRLYVARAEQGARAGPFGTGGHGITATEVMLATTAMLRAVDVQLFELGMWQAWTRARSDQSEGNASRELRTGA